MEKKNTLLRKLTLIFLSLFFVLSPELTRACDTSGYTIDNLIDNGDGTFTIQMTVNVAGGQTTGVGSTYGFYWNVDVPILSVIPASLTSSNGTTINAVITGSNITWGDPNPSAMTPFVDISANGPDESFMVTVVVQGPPTEWDGGGHEGNNCPGGSGTQMQNYEGEFECIQPIVSALPIPPTCPGAPVTLGATIINSWLPGNQVVWQPGNLMGETVVVSPTETTEYTATVTNYCGEETLTFEVEVTPFPEVSAANPNIVECEGLPVVLEVFPENAFPVVNWNPGGPGATFLIDVPPSYPFTYTATVENMCGEASVDILVESIPSPEVSFAEPVQNMCAGDTLTLAPDTVAVDDIAWSPGAQTTFEIDVSPAQTTTYTAIVTSDCGLDTASVTVEVSGSAADTIYIEACEGQTIDYNGIPLAAGSTSTFTYQTFQECDSVVTVVVNELLNSSSDVELTACEGESVDYNGQALSPGDVEDFTFAAANGCDSVVTVTVTELPTFAESLTLAACTGTTVNYNGTDLDPGTVMDFTLTAANGCDSVVTVTVNELSTFAEPLTLQTCTGTTVNYAGTDLSPGTVMDFTFTAANGCDSVVTVTVEELAIFTQDLELEACTGTTVNYAGTDLDPGTVMDFTFTTANGCDSVVTVTVTEVSAILDTLQMQACSGQTVMFDGQSLDAGSVTDFPYTTPQGCDSIVTVVVDELLTFASPLELSTCTGSTVTYDGVELDPGTVTDFTLPAANGCDSVVTVTVIELLPTTEAMTLTACENESVNFMGEELLPGSVTDFQLTNWLGCDSTLTVTVDELPIYASDLPLQACTGSTITYNGVPLPPGTALDFTLTAANGCDSVVTVTVEEVETIFESVNLATCPGSTVIFDGMPLGPNTVTDFTYQSYLGCDSVVTVTVDELDIITAELELEACENATVTFDGMELLPGSVTDFTYTTAAGCDSILTVTVVELPTYAWPLTFQACTGTMYDFNGTPLDPGSVTDFQFTASNGCDSVVTVTVEELFGASQSLTLEACTGSTVDFNGTALAPGSVTDFTFNTWQGCDSIVTVTVDEILPQASALALEACQGDFANYAGMQLAAGSVTDVMLTGSNGCDSTVTVTVNEILPQASTLELETCEGSFVEYANQQLPAGSITDVTLTGSNGCDSIVTVTVLALDVVTGADFVQGCEGEPLFYQGTEIAPGTSMDFTLMASNGCDSVVTVTALEPLPVPETFEMLEICEGGSVEIFGQLVTTPGDFSQTFTGANGCDSIHSVTVTLAPDLFLDLPEFIEIEFSDELVLAPQVNPADVLTYAWADDPTLSCLDCQNPTATPLEQTTYSLTIFDPEGCSAQDEIQVFVRKRLGVFIPNSFSPNDDGINDVFMIFSDPKTVVGVREFRVFSRWGEPVFEISDFPTNDTLYGWDGFFRGEKMNPGVFVYFAEIEFLDGSARIFKGDVALVK